jgi:large subunit ribosomal protein L18
VATAVSARERRHKRVRLKVNGTPEKPRFSVYKSLNHVYAQLIDDVAGHTLAAASTLDKEIAGVEIKGNKKGNRSNKEMARKVGELAARRAGEKGIKKAVFDRSGYKYHGIIKEVADAARAAGLEF